MRLIHWIYERLTVKTSLAAVIAALAVSAGVLLPDAISRRNTAERLAYEYLDRLAWTDADLKAQALKTGDVSALEANYSLWAPDSFQGLALMDAEGRVLSEAGRAPDMDTPGAQLLIQQALQGKPARGVIDKRMVSIYPLGPVGVTRKDEIPLGAFMASDFRSRALRKHGYHGLESAAGLRLLIGALAAAAIFVGMSWWMFIRPVRRIAAAESRVDVDGGNLPRVDEKSLPPDELGAIGRGRNYLSERLEEARAIGVQTNLLLQTAEARYRELVSRTPDIVFRLDASGRFLFVNDSMEQQLNIDKEGLMNDSAPLFECIHPEDRDAAANALTSPGDGEEAPLLVRIAPRGEDSKILWFELRCAPTRDPQGVEAVMSDVTRAKELEHSLAKAAQRFNTLWDARRALEENQTRRELMDSFARAAAGAVDADSAIVTRFDGEDYRLIGLYEIPADAVRKPWPLADAPQGILARSRRLTALLDPEQWKEHGLEMSYVGAPILDRDGETIGSVDCYGASSGVEEEDLRLIQLLADYLAPLLTAEASHPPAKPHSAIESAGKPFFFDEESSGDDVPEKDRKA